MRMNTTTTSSIVTSVEELQALYGAPAERAARKELAGLDEHCRAFIAAAPFVALATSSERFGADCSPRGDAPGWVTVEDDQTLLLPDRRGNNRIDSLRNIVENPNTALLFVVPGVNETLRVNGRAVISTDPALCARFEVEGKAPRSVIVFTVTEAFIQCARALVRSDLWNPEKHVERASLPSMGTMLAAHTKGFVDAKAYDEELPAILPTTLY